MDKTRTGVHIRIARGNKKSHQEYKGERTFQSNHLEVIQLPQTFLHLLLRLLVKIDGGHEADTGPRMPVDGSDTATREEDSSTGTTRTRPLVLLRQYDRSLSGHEDLVRDLSMVGDSHDHEVRSDDLFGKPRLANDFIRGCKKRHEPESGRGWARRY